MKFTIKVKNRKQALEALTGLELQLDYLSDYAEDNTRDEIKREIRMLNNYLNLA